MAKIALSPKQQQIAAVAAIAIIGFGYAHVRFFWLPVSDRIKKAQEDIQVVEGKIAKAKAQAARLPQLERELVILNQQAADAETRLPKTKDVPAVIDTISGLARKYKVDLANLTPSAPKTAPFFIEVPYALSFSGTYHDVGRFLAAVALEQRIFNVRNVTYARAAEDKLTVNLTLLSYQYKG